MEQAAKAKFAREETAHLRKLEEQMNAEEARLQVWYDDGGGCGGNCFPARLDFEVVVIVPRGTEDTCERFLLVFFFFLFLFLLF